MNARLASRSPPHRPPGASRPAFVLNAAVCHQVGYLRPFGPLFEDPNEVEGPGTWLQGDLHHRSKPAGPVNRRVRATAPHCQKAPSVSAARLAASSLVGLRYRRVRNRPAAKKCAAPNPPGLPTAAQRLRSAVCERAASAVRNVWDCAP